MLQRSMWSVLEDAWNGCFKVCRTSSNLLDLDVTTKRPDTSGTSWKLLEMDETNKVTSRASWHLYTGNGRHTVACRTSLMLLEKDISY